jgi:predicted CoA-substrate-specific enzyme activase
MTAGIDIGSRTSKVVIMDNNGKILGYNIMPTSYNVKESGEAILNIALEKLNISIKDLRYIISTGYGRRSITFSHRAVPEILCHAKGAKWLIPTVRTNIDIGGQDSKVIEIDEKGNVLRFAMNDKCAAGTGRFLEALAKVLCVDIEEIGSLSLNSKIPSTISSICTVFAESEVISYLSAGVKREDIASGMHKAIAKRVIAMGKGAQINYKEDVVFTGGVAKNIGVKRAIEEEVKTNIIIPKEPQITAAIGAALYGIS